MNNRELIDRFNNSLCKASDEIDVNTMITALDEYINAVVGRKNDMPNYHKLKVRDRLPVLYLANAILFHGYTPHQLSSEDRMRFHPWDNTMADGSKPRKNDFIPYLRFLETAIEYLYTQAKRKEN